MSEVLETGIPCPAFHKLSKDEERNNTVTIRFLFLQCRMNNT